MRTPSTASAGVATHRNATASMLLLLTLMGVSGRVSAQGLQTGILSGLVTDSQRLAVPGAVVTVTAPVLQGTRSVTTDGIGAYIIRGLPPGTYTVRVQLSGMRDVEETVAVPLGGVAELHAVLQPAAFQETVRVTADEVPPPLAASQISTNFRNELVGALPMGRRPFEIADLAPGVTDNTPNIGQVAVGGAFAFDSLFLIDGVDANDNLFGIANGLYVEDAIVETQVLTAGVSAEFGRFGGGVVNMITKSGGNSFSGSFRTNLYRPSWTEETPFQKQNNQQNSDTLTRFYEGTIGGPIVRDRLWFFNADRYENSTLPGTLTEIGTSYDNGTQNKRVQLKITGTPVPNHTFTWNLVNNPTDRSNLPSINAALSMDRATLVSPSEPNRLWAANWNGAVTNKLFATFQVSTKRQETLAFGGTSTNIIDSPFLSRGVAGGASPNRHYNAPYFDGNDREDRNNRQFTGSVSSYATSRAWGRHDFKVGGEHFTSWRTGGNSPSATGYVFQTDYLLGADGRPAIDSAGHPLPVWGGNAANPAAAASRIQNWLSVPGARLDIRTLSLYGQERWTLNPRVTADVGLRYEDVKTHATGDIRGADTTTWLPRLGVSVDLAGNGRTVAHATYGRYSGRFTERAFGRNTNVGTPSVVVLGYVGPSGVGRDFAPAFDLSNYVAITGSFPTANVFFDPDLTSPKTNEFTVSLGRELPRGYAKATYIWRNADGFIDDFIDDPSAAGKITVVREGVNYGTFDRVLYKNTDAPTRRYQALQLEARTTAIRRFPVQGDYTLQIRNHGDFEGEAPNQAGNPSIWFDYPEMLPANRYAPYGRLDEFQRHKLRVWGVYNQTLGRFGSVDISPLWRVNSGLTYSLFATGVPMSPIQIARNPGYARANTTTASLFFGERGSEEFKGYGVLDMAFRYGVPVWKTLQPWLQVQLFNVMNNQKLISWNTTVTRDLASPLDEIGQPTGYVKGPNFGKATANSNFPRWSTGETGGRTFRLAFGVRF